MSKSYNFFSIKVLPFSFNKCIIKVKFLWRT